MTLHKTPPVADVDTYVPSERRLARERHRRARTRRATANAATSTLVTR
ncbi:amino acid ABC transporter permease, partial [Streptomyces rubiginosohelvolus]